MAIELGEVERLRTELAMTYNARHEDFRKLRHYWHGRYWENVEDDSKTIATVFRDITRHASDVGPDLKLVYNILQQICVKYQTFLSPLPQIHVYTDPPESERRKAQAVTKQRYLYGCWTASKMATIFNQMGFYLPLFGSCFLGIHPDFDRKLPRAVLRSPENAYPIMGFDGNMDAVIFNWRVRESVIRRTFPNYVPREKRRLMPKFVRFVDPLGIVRDKEVTEASSHDPLIEILEWSDAKEWHRWIDGQEVNGLVHDYGFNLWQHVKFIDVPGEAWGHGAVEQVANLNMAENILYSLLMQSVLENVFPMLKLIDPAKAPEEILKGPGSVLPLNPGGDAGYIEPPTAGSAMSAQLLGQTERTIKEAASMPEINFGGSPVSSILTGKAVEELQGAGTGSLVEMVQGNGIGQATVNWNEQAIFLAQELFQKDSINLFGTEVDPHAINPTRFSMTIKGSKLVGGSRNEVIFSPALNLHEKLVMWLQAKGGGLVSDEYIRNQIGILDSEAMKEQIYQEAIEQGVLGGMLAHLQAAPDVQTAEQVEQQAFGYMQGATGAPPPVTAPQVAPQAAPPPGQGPSAPGGAAPPQGAAPSPGPGAAPPPASIPNNPEGVVTEAEVAGAIQKIQGLQGRVFLVGEIVQRTQTADDIEVALTNHNDQQTIQDALPQYAGKLVFHIVPGEPTEPHLEVTPGRPAQRGGGAKPNPEALRRGVFVG